MTARIRAAQSDDIDAISAIEGDADQRFAEAGHPELALGGTIARDVLEKATARQRLFVAEQADRIVGWVLLTRSEDALCVGQISVLRSAGRRGIGTLLLTHVISLARQKGEHAIVLNTQDDVAWNRPWYERHGFVVVDPAAWTQDMHVIAREQTDSGLDWSTRVHMRLDLSSSKSDIP